MQMCCRSGKIGNAIEYMNQYINHYGSNATMDSSMKQLQHEVPNHGMEQYLSSSMGKAIRIFTSTLTDIHQSEQVLDFIVNVVEHRKIQVIF